MAKKSKKPRYSDADIDQILLINQQLSEKVDGLQSQLTWFKRQIFGNKSEKLRYVDNPDQAQLDIGNHPVEEAVAEVEEIKTYQRRKKKAKPGTPDGSGIRFDEEQVEVKVIEIPCPFRGREVDQRQSESSMLIQAWLKYGCLEQI